MDSGHTAWMLMASALVLLMTPGLAFFYGGLVRARNVHQYAHVQLYGHDRGAHRLGAMGVQPGVRRG